MSINGDTRRKFFGRKRVKKISKNNYKCLRKSHMALSDYLVIWWWGEFKMFFFIFGYVGGMFWEEKWGKFKKLEFENIRIILLRTHQLNFQLIDINFKCGRKMLTWQIQVIIKSFKKCHFSLTFQDAAISVLTK